MNTPTDLPQPHPALAEWVRVATLQVLHGHLPLGLVLRDPTGTLAATCCPPSSRWPG
jgi:hypothetical protein